MCLIFLYKMMILNKYIWILWYDGQRIEFLKLYILKIWDMLYILIKQKEYLKKFQDLEDCNVLWIQVLSEYLDFYIDEQVIFLRFMCFLEDSYFVLDLEM